MKVQDISRHYESIRRWRVWRLLFMIWAVFCLGMGMVLIFPFAVNRFEINITVVWFMAEAEIIQLLLTIFWVVTCIGILVSHKAYSLGLTGFLTLIFVSSERTAEPIYDNFLVSIAGRLGSISILCAIGVFLIFLRNCYFRRYEKVEQDLKAVFQ